MSYKTLEVELEDGRVRPSSGEALPLKAHALLTILSSPADKGGQGGESSVADLAADFIGIGKGQHTDLSTNKTHLNDFGR